MVRQLRRLALGLLLGALVGWLWLRRQRLDERPAPRQGGMGETTAPYPEYPGSGRASEKLSTQPDERIVLPTWTFTPSREEDSPVGGRIVLPEGAETEVSVPPATDGTREVGDEGSVSERLERAANGAEPTAPSLASAPPTEAVTPSDTGDLAPLPPAAAGETASLAPETSGAAAAVPAEGSGSIIEGYCVRCKEQRPMVNVHPYTTANKRPALKGECAVCGAGMFKFTKE